jgi:hypothetical protein
MARILGDQLAKKFRLGYLTSNYNRIGRFTPEETAVGFGKLLKYGSSLGHYEVVEGNETSAHVIAGVSVYAQAKTGTTYPGTIEVIPFGEFGDNLLVGDIVVELSTHAGIDAADAVEGARVYLANDGKVSPDASHGTSPVVNHLLLPQFIFLGLAEVAEDGTKLVAVRKLY